MKYFFIILISLSVSLILSNPIPEEEQVTESVGVINESTSEPTDQKEQGSDEKSSEEKEEDDKKEDADEEENEHKHPFGKPINLMKFDEQENIIIDDDALNRTFMHPDVKDRKIIAVSIIGAFRKGKSFLMDYALRFMYANYKSVANPNNTLENKQNWIGDREEPLKGFSWRGGSVRDTTGVVLWSDVFLHERQDPKTKKVEKLAIILMDTQGLFDTSTSPTDNSRIFALGTLISSSQIFNLNDVIQEDQLQYLQMATDFAKFAMKKNKQKKKNAKPYKPFQTLIFLMRDWQNQEDHDYGHIGGANYLAKVLTVLPGQPKDLQEVRQYITESFEETNCFLLPHPGLKVVNNKNYDGRYSELNEDFQEQLKDLLNWLLSPKYLKKKKILGDEVIGSEYFEYVSAYFEAFQSKDIPKVDTLHGITVRKQYDIVMQESFAEYKNQIQPVEFKIGEAWKEFSIIEQEFKKMNTAALQKALQIFKSKEKLGSKNDEKKYEKELKKQLNEYFDDWKSKQLETYTRFKDLEIQKQRELDELNKKKEEELRKVQEEAELKRLALEEEHKNKTEQLNKTIDAVKAEAAENMEKLAQDFEKGKKEAEENQQKLQLRFEEETVNIQKQANETESRLKTQLDEMQKKIKATEEEARKLAQDTEKKKLEELKNQTELKRMELENQMKIAEKREEAMKEKLKLEHETRLKEIEIREQREKTEREERRKAEEDTRIANQEIERKRFESAENSRKEELEAQRRRDDEFKLILAKMLQPQTTTTAAPESLSYGSSLKCVFSFGLAC